MLNAVGSPLEGHVNSRFSLYDVFIEILIALTATPLLICRSETQIRIFCTLKQSPGVVSEVTEQCGRRLLLPLQLAYFLEWGSNASTVHFSTTTSPIDAASPTAILKISPRNMATVMVAKRPRPLTNGIDVGHNGRVRQR